MKTISIHEAKAHFSELIGEAQDQERPVILSRYGNPVAEIKPLPSRERCIPGRHLSKVKIGLHPTKLTLTEWKNA